MHKPTHFTVELETPGTGWRDLQEATARARRVTEEMRREGTRVRFLRSIFVPEEDACFFLFACSSARLVRDAAVRAELGVQSVRAAMRIEPREEREETWS